MPKRHSNQIAYCTRCFGICCSGDKKMHTAVGTHVNHSSKHCVSHCWVFMSHNIGNPPTTDCTQCPHYLAPVRKTQ